MYPTRLNSVVRLAVAGVLALVLGGPLYAQVPRALEAARAAAARNPRSVDAQLELADAALRFQQQAEAMRAVQTAASLAPENPKPKAMLAKAQIYGGMYAEGI